MGRSVAFAALMGLLLQAQVIFYQQDFNAAGVPTDWSLNTGDMGSTTTGLYNEWIVGADYNNPPPTFQVPCAGLCLPTTNIPPIPPQPPAIVGAPNSSFLHVSYVPSVSTAGGCTPPPFRVTSFLGADGIACYFAQRYFAKLNTAVSIPAGTAPVKLSFFWLCKGNASGYGEVYYSTNGGTIWTILTSSVTNTQRLFDRATQWNADTITLPITRPASVLIGFRFVNNDRADGDPPLAVDAIRIFEDVPAGPTITITGIPPVPQVCAGNSLSVSFSTNGTFNAGNQFEVQLSDAGGSFNSPIATARGAGSPISVTIPAAAASGTYKLRVVSTSPQVVSNVVDVQVVNLSNLSCTADPNPVRAGNSVTLTVSGSGLPAGPFDVSLTPGDGSPAQSRNNVAGLPVSFTHTYASAGSYTGTFTVTHPASGCSRTCQVTVQVAAADAPTITLQPLVPWACAGDGITVNFTTQGTFGGNNTFSVQLSDAGGSFNSPTVIGRGSDSPVSCVIPGGTPSGSYRIRVVASDPANVVSNEQPISIANLSGLSCSVSPTPVEPGQAATFTVGGNGLPAGSYTLTLTPGNGDADRTLDNQNLPANLTHTYAAEGQYTARIRVVHEPSGCASICDVTVSVGRQVLTLNAPQPAQVCAGTSFQVAYQATNIVFGADNVFTLEVLDGSGAVVSRCTAAGTAAQGTLSCQIPASLPAGTYQVRLVSSNPRFQSTSQNLTVLASPNADFTASDTVLSLPAENLVLFVNTSTGATSYSWDFGNGQTSTQTTPDPISYTTPGTYTVTLIAISANGCRDTAQRVIVARAAEELIIPNVFTPNGDGTNDRFIIRYSGAKQVEVALYDRWGNLIWSQNQSALSGTLEWDGTLRGTPAPEGVYTGVATMKALNGREIRKAFTVTLLR